MRETLLVSRGKGFLIAGQVLHRMCRLGMSLHDLPFVMASRYIMSRHPKTNNQD